MQPQTQSTVNPLIRQLGLQDLLKRDAARIPEADDINLTGPVESSLAGHIRLAWSRSKLVKTRVARKMLADLRARRGVYGQAQIDAMQASRNGGNLVWHPLTEVKCRAGSAWIRDIVLPIGEQPWGIDPTPLPDLPKPMKDAIVVNALKQAQQAMVQAGQQGAVMSPQEFRQLAGQLGEKLRDDAETTYKKMAAQRARRMEQQIADRLAEGGYYEAMDAFVEDFVTYAAAILKGPVYTRHHSLKWDANFTPVQSDTPQQTWSHVSPFDVYPGPGCISPQKGDFIERMRFRRDELYDLKGLPNYHDDQIDLALRDYTNGHLEGWLWTEAERLRLEQETIYMYLAPPGVIDALNYWGRVPGWKLMSWGVKGNLEETKEYECNVLLCGKYVLYATLNSDPLGARPYYKACYDAIPGSFWGRSVPDLATTPQQMCNAIACAQADNWSIASGPQVWVHADRFADGEQSMDMFPWKIWQMKSDPTQGTNPGIGFFQPSDNSEKLMPSLDKWEIRADDSTGIPRYTYGNERAGGSADTATGLGMLMNNAAKGLRRAISNIDTYVIAPTIEATFVNEMLYNPNESIKGDNQVVARGAAAILVRDAAQQHRIQFLAMTANPIDSQIITTKYRAALLRETAKAMELPVDECVPSEEALDAQMQAQAQAQQQAAQQALQMHQAQKSIETQADVTKIGAETQGRLAVAQVKEQGTAQRDQMASRNNMVADVVKQAISAALVPKQIGDLGGGGKSGLAALRDSSST